jgi:hypothetical protein
MGDVNLPCDSDICRHWTKGFCKFAKSCAFAHGQQQVQQTTASSAASSTDAEELSSSAAATQTSSSSTAASASLTPSSSSIEVKQHTKGWPREEARVWAHIFLFIHDVGFDMVPRLIGSNGINTRTIYLATKAKVRIRGEGSGHLEVLNAAGIGVKEAPVPLQIAVTTQKSCTRQFRKAVDMTIALLVQVQASYKTFCTSQHLPIHITDAPMFAFGEVCQGTEGLLMDLLKKISPPRGSSSQPEEEEAEESHTWRFEAWVTDVCYSRVT